MTVLWSTPVEHFHVTQLGIRGAVPAAILSYLEVFSELQKLTYHGVSHEVVIEMNRRLPNCRIVMEN